MILDSERRIGAIASFTMVCVLAYVCLAKPNLCTNSEYQPIFSDR